MIDLRKPVTRRTRTAIWSQGRYRELVITLEPVGESSVITFRLAGTRQVYEMSAETAFRVAVEQKRELVQRRAARIAAATGKSMRAALIAARSEL